MSEREPMMMWLQTRRVRHLTINAGALCSATPKMFWDKGGHARFTFWPTRDTKADLDLPICSRCAHTLDRLKAEAV